MFEEINRFFDDLPRIILDDLRKNGMPLNRMNYNDIIAGISYLSSVICNKQITKIANLEVPNIPKTYARDLLKTFLNYLDTNTIKFFLERHILLSETKYNPIKTITFYDQEQTIRAVNIPDEVIEQIWNSMPLDAQKNQKMKRYFKYRLDDPPLTVVIPFLSDNFELIDYVKGHGMSPIIRIPKKVNKDFSYLIGV
jgi:hypothetical protein